MARRILVPALAATALAVSYSPAFGCEATEMATTAEGFIHKVVAGSDKIRAYKTPEGKEDAYTMELLQPYFVICETGEYFKITDIPAESVEEAMTGNVGYVRKTQSHLWPTREALEFAEIAFMDTRPEIVAWGDDDTLDKFMETGDKTAYPPAFQEDLESTLKRERTTRPYPVLGSDMRKLRNVADKRVFHALVPAALPAAARIEIKDNDVEKAKEALTRATIVVVFDATASMGDFAVDSADSIAGAVESLPKEVIEKSSMGFVFYRDVGDTEKLVDVPPIPIKEAAESLRKASKLMDGGGDAAEPILDATYFAANLYDWGKSAGGGEQISGRKILIGVLNDDAHPKTLGTLDEKGRIPAGLDARAVAQQLVEKNIVMITVQAGPTFGPNLESVLTTLADATGREFIRWEAGATRTKIAANLTKEATGEAAEVRKKGEAALEELKFDLTGYATIPLKVLDGEMMERLRRNGVEFNIDPGEGGVLVREGYIIENDDLLTPKIQIEKETLQHLINLYTVLGTTGVDSEAFMRSAGEAIAAIAGENYDPNEKISEVIRKNAGIQFRSELLNFDLQFLDAMNRDERLKYTKRIQDAGTSLSQYLEANLAEFDSQPAVWMPVKALP